MSLAEEIKKIEKCSALTYATKEAALKEIIGDYRHKITTEKYNRKKTGKVVKIAPPVEGIVSKREYNPAIESVINGNTTFMKEYRKLGSLEFILTGNGGITGGEKRMAEQIKLVDETIFRLYVRPSWGPPGPGEDYWC